MEKTDIKELIGELKRYQDQVKIISNGKPKRKDMDKFKTYYEKTYKKLVEYIQFTKDKKLSEKARELPVLKKLFSTFNIYMAFLIVLMIGPVSLIVYLYSLGGHEELIFAIVGVDIIVIFLLVRKVQQESIVVIDVLLKAVPIVNNVTKIIEDISRK